jgi:hypothetical protein
MRQSSAKNISSHRRTQYIERMEMMEANIFDKTQLLCNATIKRSLLYRLTCDCYCYVATFPPRKQAHSASISWTSNCPGKGT